MKVHIWEVLVEKQKKIVFDWEVTQAGRDLVKKEPYWEGWIEAVGWPPFN